MTKKILNRLKKADKKTVIIPQKGKSKEIRLCDLNPNEATVRRNEINIPFKDGIGAISISTKDLSRVLSSG